MYNKTVLDNGLKILTEEINEFKSASVGIWVNGGPKQETQADMGVSHFIEHMLFKGTKTRTATDIAEIMDSVGGHLNAFTEKEQTCFYSKVMDIHLPLCLEVLSDMFVNSVFDPVELERERGVILEEIKMYEDTPDDVVFEEFNHTLWGDHPLACPTLGRVETVSRFTRDHLFKFMKDFYTPDNVVVCAAGHLKHDEVVELVQKYLGGLTGTVKPHEDTLPEFHTRNKLRYRDCEQVYMCMGGKGLHQLDNRKYVFFVLDSILGGSMSSRLFQEIREKRGLVYTVSTFANAYHNVAQFGIYAGTSKENIREVIKLCYEIIDSIREKGVTEKEVTRAKEHIKGGISLSLESTSNRMIRLNKSEFHHKRMIPIEEVIQKIDAVTLEDVNTLALELLAREKYSTAILGPIEGEMDELLKGL